MHALVVCDRNDEGGLLAFSLRQIGLTVAQMSDLEGAMQAFTASPSDLLVLALRQVPLAAQVRLVRADSDVCLALVTDAIAEDIICEAYEAGADEIVLRPFSVRTLAMQLKALLRRGSGTMLHLFPSFGLGDLTLDPSTRSVHVGDHSRRLTHLEFRLLHTLMLHHGQTVPMETIVEHVWGYNGAGDTELVRGLVRRLRTKVEGDPRQPRYILSVPGVGYRLEANE